MPRVTIHSRSQIPGPNAPGAPELITQVIYSTDATAPRPVVIDKADPTDEEIAEAIRADLAALAERPPQQFEV